MNQAVSDEIEVVWRPIEGTSQELAIDSRAHHTLYEGARGPGKTLTQLMRFRRRVGLGYGRYWKGVIFDREFDNLSGLVTESKKWFSKFNDGAVFLESASSYKWVWPTGEELLFRHVKKIGDYDGFHGHEYPFIGWNELTRYSNGDLYDKFMSCNRCTFTPERDTPHRVVRQGDKDILDAFKCADGTYRVFDTPDRKPLPQIPLEVFSTTNPDGPGHNWVKARFIDIAPRGVLVSTTTRVFNPQTQQDEDVTKTQITLFGSYRENKYLTPEYVAELEKITDPNLRKAWLFGDWDISAGDAFGDLWNSAYHVIPRFAIPKGWSIDRAFDWGSSQPYSVGWWAEANGEEAKVKIGNEWFTFCPPAGSLIQFFEDYSAPKIEENKGNKLSAKNTAKRIIEIEKSLKENGWVEGEIFPGPADNAISNVTESDTETIEKKMADNGVTWQESDKSKGSRTNGFQLFRDRLEAVLENEGPGIYFMQNCTASISTIPKLPRDPVKVDDVDTTAIDHPWDMTRYRVLKSSNRLARSIKVKF
ncbi:Phage terminase, large subunit [Xanthomonas phage Suba]|uniref:Phage terminase, large subunit n=1 Tax=Xanthomonas phage Suba TaxID=2674975 RepID=A0A679KEJ7_9CAUD|nr:Phage terminase, large subunit [Xanthomonas phage Suba]CAA2409733.1 Phage terminase, large subunit [Xanthomonas phage Suba]